MILRPYLVVAWCKAWPFFLLNQCELTGCAGWSVDSNTQSSVRCSRVQFQGLDLTVRAEGVFVHHGPCGSSVQHTTVFWFITEFCGRAV